jgi:hypothetical protein
MTNFSTGISNIIYLKNEVVRLAEKNGFNEPCYKIMLDYTINNLQSSGLGEKYYGYHNIDHLLEIPLGALLVGDSKQISNLSSEDLKYLLVSAIFHDFEVKENGEKSIQKCFENSKLTKNNPEKQEHYIWLGWLLSVIDRMISYALGDFSKAIHVAKMNSHALGWHPEVLARRSVVYFDDLIKNELKMSNLVLKCLPKEMQDNFMNNVQKFTKLREREIKIQNDFKSKKLKFVPKMESGKIKQNNEFSDVIHSIFLELPRPLRFNEKKFQESLTDSETVLTTLRLDRANGKIIGFAKGSMLENYNLRAEINDENHGKRNTIFLEPIALSTGYWGLGAGHILRQSFIMQAHTLNYKYLTSFAFRDVITSRANGMEKAEFVTKFDPERWDYYRIEL